jgi:hypothetical protein
MVVCPECAQRANQTKIEAYAAVYSQASAWVIMCNFVTWAMASAFVATNSFAMVYAAGLIQTSPYRIVLAVLSIGLLVAWRVIDGHYSESATKARDVLESIEDCWAEPHFYKKQKTELSASVGKVACWLNGAALVIGICWIIVASAAISDLLPAKKKVPLDVESGQLTGQTSRTDVPPVIPSDNSTPSGNGSSVSPPQSGQPGPSDQPMPPKSKGSLDSAPSSEELPK